MDWGKRATRLSNSFPRSNATRTHDLSCRHCGEGSGTLKSASSEGSEESEGEFHDECCKMRLSEQ